MWRVKKGLKRRGKEEEGVGVGGIGGSEENRGRRPRVCMWHSVGKWYVFNYVWRELLRDCGVLLHN